MKIRRDVWLCIIYDCKAPSSFLWKVWRIVETLPGGGNKTNASPMW